MVPLNFAHNNNADYVLSGSWSKKAIAEGSKLTKVNTIASSENHGFSYAQLKRIGNIQRTLHMFIIALMKPFKELQYIKLPI